MYKTNETERCENVQKKINNENPSNSVTHFKINNNY